MVATHLFQMMTFLAMEPPVSFEPDRLRDETVKVLRADAARATPTDVVRGQYDGYRTRSRRGADDSTVETFAAMELEIDNWRWADVPFFLRTGKGLARKVSEITLKFRKVPFNVFRGTDVDLAEARPPRRSGSSRTRASRSRSTRRRPGPGLSSGG